MEQRADLVRGREKNPVPSQPLVEPPARLFQPPLEPHH
jgi:hypothetical protein